GVPCPRFSNNAVLHTHIKQAPFTGDTLAVKNVEFGLFERWSHLIFDNFRTGAVPDRVTGFFKSFDATDVNAYCRVELQCLTACSSFGRSKESPNFLTQLVDEYSCGF